MATTSPIRIDDELYKSASIVGPVMSRSASQQVQHWARIGRELEEADMAAGAIAEVLAGARSYDDIDARQQAIVRAEWEARVVSSRACGTLSGCPPPPRHPAGRLTAAR